jgi:hypothetical protein
MGSPWWQNPPSSALSLLHHPLRVEKTAWQQGNRERAEPKGGALALLVVPPYFAHLRVWEVGWGNVPLDLCGVLVRESRATWLAGARWGLPLVCTADPLVGPL